MIETYKVGRLKFVRNFGKRGGKFFYVIYKYPIEKNKNNRWLHSEWIGKILFNKKSDCWIIEFEDENKILLLTEEEKKSIYKIKDLISKDYKW